MRGINKQVFSAYRHVLDAYGIRAMFDMPQQYRVRVSFRQTSVRRHHGYSPFPITCIRRSSRDGIVFVVFSIAGSLARINVNRRELSIVIVQGDELIEYLLLKTEELLRILPRAVLIHAAWVSKRNMPCLFVGESGVGKTTLAEVLTRNDSSFRQVQGDITIAYLDLRGFACVWSPQIAERRSAAVIFFVERDRNRSAAIRAIGRREAYLRLLMHADIDRRKNAGMLSRKLDLVHRLVLQTHSFVLVNGTGLHQQPERLRALMRDALKEVI